MKKLTTAEFIAKARSVHGDLYDYSLANYVSAKQNIKIICPIHGLFEQQAYLHSHGAGCPDCSGKKKKTTKQFINEALSVHGDKYSYRASIYLSAHKKVEIICPYHGAFFQTPASHIMQGAGCPNCAGNVKRDTQSFIKEAQKVHGNLYDYSQAEYVNDGSRNKTKLKIICKVHGEFWQRGGAHLKGQGCPLCGQEKVAGIRRKTYLKFVEDAKRVHGDTYQYDLVEYVNDTEKVQIVCKKHGPFWQSPGKHIAGQQCSQCSVTGFDIGKPALIYFLKIQTAIATFWKIGITNRSVKERFGIDYELIKSGWIWHGDGKIIWNTEQDLLRQYQEHKLNYLFPLLKNGGDTECFTLNLPVPKIVKEITQKLKTPPEEIKAGQK